MPEQQCHAKEYGPMKRGRGGMEAQEKGPNRLPEQKSMVREDPIPTSSRPLGCRRILLPWPTYLRHGLPEGLVAEIHSLRRDCVDGHPDNDPQILQATYKGFFKIKKLRFKPRVLTLVWEDLHLLSPGHFSQDDYIRAQRKQGGTMVNKSCQRIGYSPARQKIH